MQKQNKLDAYKYTGYFFLALFAFIFFAFYKTYFSNFPNFKSSIKSAFLIHFHAVISFLWVVLLVAQPILIQRKKYHLHKMLGKITYLLVPLILGSFVALMYVKYFDEKMSEWPLKEIIYYFYFQILHTVFFSVFYFLAIYYKYQKKILLHGGFMIATGLIFINPIMRRVLFNGMNLSFPVAETVALAITDIAVIWLMLSARRNNAPYRFYYVILMMFTIYQVPMLALLYGYRPY